VEVVEELIPFWIRATKIQGLLVVVEQEVIE
jgi:hypothetical protein